jgi:shikimate kinase
MSSSTIDTATWLQGTTVYLIGPMGAGKTTVGQVLAESLGYRYFDTDQVIETAAQQSIAQIFADSGEAVFRQLETDTLQALSPLLRCVIATGGGIVLKPENWGYLRNGVIVWLDVPVDLLHDRLIADTTRPLLQAGNLRDRLQTLDQERRSRYAQADIPIAIAAGESPEAIVQRILQSLTEACQSKAAADTETRRLNAESPYQVES